MKLLGIDTALNACSVAIVEDGAVLVRVVSPGGKGNAERLLPVLERARQQADIALSALDGIAATVGPGSFTGIRTALATARALGLALGKPVWGITTTEVLAEAAAEPGRATVAAIDARRGEVYLQAFAAAETGQGKGRLGEALTDPMLLPIAAAVTRLPQGPLTLVGSGAALLQAAIAGRKDVTMSSALPDPDPALVAQLALRRPPPPRPPAPLYIRPPDAALPVAPQPRAQLAVDIVPCGRESAALLAGLHGEAFDAGWSGRSLAELLAMPGALALLALNGDQPAGFLLLRQAADEAEVITLAVRPRLRRLGVARTLMQAGLTELAARNVAACFLEVAEDNDSARALYRGLGFAEVGTRPGYYDGEPNPVGQGPSVPPVTATRRNAIVMKKAIAN